MINLERNIFKNETREKKKIYINCGNGTDVIRTIFPTLIDSPIIFHCKCTKTKRKQRFGTTHQNNPISTLKFDLCIHYYLMVERQTTLKKLRKKEPPRAICDTW